MPDAPTAPRAVSAEQRARDALLACMNEPLFLEAYLPHITTAIQQAEQAQMEADCQAVCAWCTDKRADKAHCEETVDGPQWFHYRKGYLTVDDCDASLIREAFAAAHAPATDGQER